jgi:hypothetical protein
VAPQDRTTVQSPDPGVGTPSRDDGRSSDILLVEVAKLQSDGEYIKRDLGEVRNDTKDVRDRLTRLEERVAHLPSKGFIVLVVTTGLVISVGLATAITGLQNYLSPPKQLLSPSTPPTLPPAKPPAKPP